MSRLGARITFSEVLALVSAGGIEVVLMLERWNSFCFF